MANRFIGGVLSSRPQANTPFSSRASTGTYFDSAGVMRTAPINQPRLNYSLVGGAWTQPTVLIEPETTNIIPYSQDFTSGAGWGAVASTITSNTALAPDGTTTASSWILNSGSSEHYIARSTTLVDGRRYTYSIYAKPVGKNWIILNHNNYTGATYTYFNISTGSIGTTGPGVTPSIVNAGNGWYRCAVTITHSAALYGSNGPQLYMANDTGTSSSFTGDGVSGVYIWGAQMETNFGTTSYIPTAGTAVTRAADVVGPGTSGIYNLEDRQTTTATDDQATVTSFTSTGSTTWTAPADINSVEVLVVAGGGSGGGGSGAIGGGGGGAGGIIYNTSYPVTPGTTYPVVVGAGGVGANRVKGTNGSNSQFGALVALGGGAGASDGSISNVGTPGGSGGGGGGRSGIGAPGTAGQGNSGSNGATSAYYAGGAGGGAGGPATPFFGSVAGSGGPGLYFNISGTSTAYGGGGGGGGSTYSSVSTAGSGGVGGGGGGTSNSTNGTAGTANTGGGGGASGWNTDSGTSFGGNGGSGVVIVKYKRTPRQITSTSNAAVVVQKFSTTNLWTVPTGVTQVEALVVAGGGGGGNGTAGGGAGAGGVVYSSALAVTPGSTYTIGVGGGGVSGLDQASLPSRNGFGSGIGTGSELITNGSAFTVTTGWSATTATLSVPQTGIFRILPNASVNGTASQSITTVNGVTYVAVVKVTSDVAKFFRLYVGTTQVGNEITSFFTNYTNDSLDNGATGAGFYSVIFTATGSTTWINMQIGGGTQQATDISYISVRQASLPATGGGNGGSESGTAGHRLGGNGGSGGGGDYASAGGNGTAGQGNAGGTGISGGNNWTGGGGGGAGGAGGTALKFYPGNGGPGVAYSITGNLEYYGGGGGGSSQNSGGGTVYIGTGGIGGGGTGPADQTGGTVLPGQNGAPNTGGGGGAQADATGSGGVGKGNGGSGVVILRYRVPQVATFLDSGAWTCPAGVTSVQALVVAGGGGGGYCLSGDGGGGGGGAGGLLHDNSIPVRPGVTYPVVVGQGGAPAVSQTVNGSNGSNSNFANLIAIGGGGGGSTRATGSAVINSGGSGGGAGSDSGGDIGGAGTYGQGNAGGNCTTGGNGGGGGGAGSNGVSVSSNSDVPNGGAGLAYSISGTSTTYAGGGGGGKYGAGTGDAGSGGAGGGGSGGKGFTGTPGLINTGGGGGGGGMSPTSSFTGSAGGSGIVIIRWIGG